MQCGHRLSASEKGQHFQESACKILAFSEANSQRWSSRSHTFSVYQKCDVDCFMRARNVHSISNFVKRQSFFTRSAVLEAWESILIRGTPANPDAPSHRKLRTNMHGSQCCYRLSNGHRNRAYQHSTVPLKKKTGRVLCQDLAMRDQVGKTSWTFLNHFSHDNETSQQKWATNSLFWSPAINGCIFNRSAVLEECAATWSPFLCGR